MISDKDFFGFLIVLLIVAAIVGWGVIEGVIWIASHLDISWAQPTPTAR